VGRLVSDKWGTRLNISKGPWRNPQALFLWVW